MRLDSTCRLGISRTCQDPAAAWQFVRTLLLEDGQRALQASPTAFAGFPARMDLLQELADAACEVQPLGTTKNVSGYVLSDMGLGVDIDFFAYVDFIRNGVTADDDELWSRPLTDEEIEQYMRIFREVDSFAEGDITITDILIEEAEAYYNGQRSAAETAKIIQDRVQTYLAEQG